MELVGLYSVVLTTVVLTISLVLTYKYSTTTTTTTATKLIVHVANKFSALKKTLTIQNLCMKIMNHLIQLSEPLYI